ncbi:MAG TPA: hypothetical protein DD670_05710 [Planctomycetaceae bacterium]|nr:hypothetical protein [Planctomycetaceae bacterium]
MNVIADKLRRRKFDTVADVHGIAQLIGYVCGPDALRDYLNCAPRNFKELWKTPTELLVTLRTRLQLQIACRVTAESGSTDGRDGNEVLGILNNIIDQRTVQGDRCYPRHLVEKQTREIKSMFGGSEKPR